ncbi:hypothetical protein AXF42_Ash007308 [Apostasia shenzhenica]|uniref:Uncharacterized protein n=1 Tax=Apostasia shenzhenica TaxID=1088818 RepID=A0A2I0B9T8_9ASPA|nr:hypothetical protein AXF42_Ash007308 [Apostasia shenzhenica]
MVVMVLKALVLPVLKWLECQMSIFILLRLGPAINWIEILNQIADAAIGNLIQHAQEVLII